MLGLHMKIILSFVLFLAGLDQCLAATGKEENPLTAQGQLSSYRVEAHQIVDLKIKLFLPKGYKAYQDQFKVKISSPADFKIQNFTIAPLKQFYDANSQQNKMGVIDSATFSAPIEAPADLTDGDQILKVDLTYQACTKTYCLFPVVRTIEIPFLGKAAEKPQDQRPFWKLEFKDVFARGLVTTFLFVFLAGFLTSFTPCIFPMIPITIAVLGRSAHERTKGHNFLLSVLYVLGIAITYSLMGVLAAASGQMFGSFISSPFVIGLVCVVFLAMALSLFGLYEIQPPAFIRDRLAGDLHVHGYSSAFIYGVIAGLVASPCVGPVLVGVLTYIAQTQNLWLGFWLMFVFALGMGQLFLLVGLSSQATKLLPKSGRWMDLVKKALGLMMLGVCVYYLSMIVPTHNLFNKLFFSNVTTTTKASEVIEAKWLTLTKQNFDAAKSRGKPMIIDFWADWCAACHELDQKTFSQLEFIEASNEFTLFKFDATNDSPELSRLKQEYEIVGLPTVVFIDSSGKWRRDLTVNEYVDVEIFLKKMKSLSRP